MDEFDSYVVVVNDEDQHALWPAFRSVPDGWLAINAAATKEECLALVEREWTDIRPRSLREAMGR
jgi:MbtH protein